MNLREYYKRLIAEIFSLPEDFLFQINFPLKNFDASSDAIIFFSKLKKIPVENLCSEIFFKIKSRKEFENIYIKNNGILYWNIPKNIWLKKLSSDVKSKNFQKIPNLKVENEIFFKIIYVYTRINSVLNHFLQVFKNFQKIDSINLDLLSRKDIINLVKMILKYSENDFFESSEDIKKYFLKLINAFDFSWNISEEGSELCFILPNNFEETSARIFVLNVLKYILELNFTMDKELKNSRDEFC